MDEAPTLPRRRRRLGLYLPYALLLLVAIGWSVAWVVIRSRVVSGLDGWIAQEAAAGRTWTCQDRQAGGYPFRIEIRCAGLTLQRPDVLASLGQLVVVSQIYEPGHIVAEVTGPLKATAGTETVEATWRLLQASVHMGDVRPERVSVVTEDPAIRISSAASPDIALRATHLETHLRPDPAEPRTYDLALRSAGTVIPGLDAMIGGTEPADLSADIAIGQALDLPARPIAAEFERWRAAGGRVTVNALTLTKGTKRIEGKGSVALDDAHRPQAEAQLQVASIEGVLGRFVGGRSGGAAGLLGALFGGQAAEPAPAATAGNTPPLRALPPLRIDGGRLYLGPIPIPGVRIPALY